MSQEQQADRIIIQEGLNALQNSVLMAEMIEERAPVPLDDMAIYSNAEVTDGLLRFCLYAGMAWACLFDAGHSETNARKRRDRVRRVGIVRAYLGDVDVEPLRCSAVRNGMVHMDEWILKAARQLPKAGWLHNLALSHRHCFSHPSGGLVYCRVYISAEKRILHLGEELDMEAYMRSAKVVLDRLGVLDAEKAPPAQ